MPTQAERAQQLQRLHREPGTFVIPNPWDVGSARLLAMLGFQALATSSAGLAFAKGRPDNHLSRDEVLAHLRELSAACALPVSADLEGGFGLSPQAVAETLTLAAQAGAVGGAIEDSTGEAAQPLLDIALAQDRIRAAAEAARALPFPFMLTARAENFFVGRPDLADTIRRLQAYQDAGADVLFAPGLKTLDDIATVVRAVDRPVNVLMGMVGVDITVQQLAEVGVKRVSVGGSLARAAWGGFMRAAQEISGQGNFAYAQEAVPMAQLNTWFAR
jgi:2-methylisocitrate lyase-like PEP mutase family enzyme